MALACCGCSSYSSSMRFVAEVAAALVAMRLTVLTYLCVSLSGALVFTCGFP